ncbi:PepSY domain-containing protein [Halosquirtibacter laminarini]|uniref:PepSY domain-containing protein n=1 Tax=Halosquirtibacter laminarini TaxID=3374600 RepID=A0AC61NHI5_9BACT|nr:PepSY domain-containing protein [Prolixibacteraceae bacterium]
MKSFNWRKINRKLHLWIGLSSGLILFIVSLSGTMFVFADEVIDWCAGDAKYVQVEEGQKKLPPSVLIASFHERYPERGIFYFDTYKKRERSFRVASNRDKKDFAYTYINPYTGDVIKTSRSYWFFYTVAARIHAHFMVPKYGHYIVSYATLLFFFELLGGLILWYPRRWNRSSRKSSFTVKLGGKLQRKFYDIHKVIGFYVLVPSLIICITGLCMGFPSWNKIAQSSFDGTTGVWKKSREYMPKYEENRKRLDLDNIVSKLQDDNSTAEVLRVGLPFMNPNQTYYMIIQGAWIGIKCFDDAELFYVNRYNGKRIVFPERLIRAFEVDQVIFNFHVGHWMGLWGKIFTFIIGLIMTSMPVTGFVIWLNRRRD